MLYNMPKMYFFSKLIITRNAVNFFYYFTNLFYCLLTLFHFIDCPIYFSALQVNRISVTIKLNHHTWTWTTVHIIYIHLPWLLIITSRLFVSIKQTHFFARIISHNTASDSIRRKSAASYMPTFNGKSQALCAACSCAIYVFCCCCAKSTQHFIGQPRFRTSTLTVSSIKQLYTPYIYDRMRCLPASHVLGG